MLSEKYCNAFMYCRLYSTVSYIIAYSTPALDILLYSWTNILSNIY